MRTMKRVEGCTGNAERGRMYGRCREREGRGVGNGLNCRRVDVVDDDRRPVSDVPTPQHKQR